MAAAANNDALLKVENLQVEFRTRRGTALVLNGVDFERVRVLLGQEGAPP